MDSTERDATGGRRVAADKVEGATVYNQAGEKLGIVASVMTDKLTGEATYAILSFGGLLGLFDHHHPVPWSVLTYDRARGGYVVALDSKTLASAPRFRIGERIDWESPDFGRRVDEYYRRPSYRA